MRRSINGAYAATALERGIDNRGTGSTPATARIVQHAASSILRRQGCAAESRLCWSSGSAIRPPPPHSRHSAPEFGGRQPVSFMPKANRQLRRTGDRGHSIGFDLPCSNGSEAGRLAWRRHAAGASACSARSPIPRCPDQSLDTLAGCSRSGNRARHTALGDARAAAEIFVPLIPHLAQRGIRTPGPKPTGEPVSATRPRGKPRAGSAGCP